MVDIFSPHSKQNSAFDNDVGLYADICSHCKSWKNFMVAGSKTTSAHENCHGIASELRMKRFMNANGDIWDSIEDPPLDIRKPFKEFGSTSLSKEELPDSYELWQPNARYEPVGAGRINGFYLGENRAVILQEPNVRKSAAVPFVPKSMRAARYSLYIAGQSAWDDTPLYIYDEFVAYVMGCWTALDLKKRGSSVETNQDHIYGPMEFINYSIALCMAIDKGDKDYWTREPKFIPFNQFLLTLAFNVFHEAKTHFPWGDATKLFDVLESGADGKPMRDFLKSRFDFVVPKDVVKPDSKLGRDRFKLI